MKNILYFSLFIFALGFVACSDDDDEMMDPPATVAFAATVDGEALTVDTLNADLVDFFGTNLIFVTAVEASSSNAITLLIPAEIAPGTFEVEADDVALQFNDADMNDYTTEGSFTLSAIDTSARTVAGTFSFTATSDDVPNPVVITDGEFNVTYE